MNSALFKEVNSPFDINVVTVILILVSPADGIEMVGVEKEYEIGKKVGVKCRVPPALPPPNITWTINGVQV